MTGAGPETQKSKLDISERVVNSGFTASHSNLKLGGQEARRKKVGKRHTGIT